MSQTRRLAAILAADVAGYSRLMGADEEGTLERLKALRRELLDPKIAEHQGRIVKTTGDGLLVEFASVVDAVRCAVAVQQAMPERNTGVAADSRIELRIGINLGDVIVEGDDLYGDGVNIAARIEALADAGGVFVSNTVHDHVRDRLPFVFEDLGEQQVKNIARPVRVYRVRDARPPAAERRQPRRRCRCPDKPSIAVLPFANMSGDPEQEYFADGMVEEIITALSAHPLALRHRPQFEPSPTRASRRREAGRARTRASATCLEGSVRKGGPAGAHHRAADRRGKPARISGPTASTARSRTYSSLQDKVAIERRRRYRADVAGRRDAPLRRAADGRPQRLRSLPARACDDLSDNEGADFRGSGIARAGDRDRSALRAGACLGGDLSHDGCVDDGWAEMRRGQTAARRIDFARRALEVGGDDPGILANAAIVLAYFGEDIGAMIGLVDRALALNPSFARGWYVSGILRSLAGQHDLAIEHVETSLRLSPRERMGQPLSRDGRGLFLQTPV